MTFLYKRLLAIAIVLGVVFSFSACGSNELDVTEEFLNAVFEGDGKKAASLSSEALREATGAQTEKIFVNRMETACDSVIEGYKDRYGKKWKYNIEVIDSYDWEPDEYSSQKYCLSGDEFKIVEIEINHKGSGFLNDKEGKENKKVYLEKVDGKWLVVSY